VSTKLLLFKNSAGEDKNKKTESIIIEYIDRYWRKRATEHGRY